MRVSDAERDEVAAELAEHLKDGRLQVAEFDERVGLAIGARTRGDLDGLVRDLPRLAPSRLAPSQLPPSQLAPSQPPAQYRARLPFPLVAIVIFVTGMIVIGGVGHAAAVSGHPAWAVWWLWWLIPFTIFLARRRFYRQREPR